MPWTTFAEDERVGDTIFAHIVANRITNGIIDHLTHCEARFLIP
jgi:hypothetical protein